MRTDARHGARCCVGRWAACLPVVVGVQVREGLSTILDTMPKGGGGGGGLSREQLVDHIAEDLLAKVRMQRLQQGRAHEDCAHMCCQLHTAACAQPP